MQDANFGIGEGETDRADFLHAIGWVDGDKASTFGEAIAFDNLHAGDFLKAVEQFRRQWGRAGESTAQGMDLGVDRAL